MARSLTTVWFQATDNCIWYLSGNKPLKCQLNGLDTLSEWSLLDQGSIIDDAFVPAMRANAELLRVLYAQHTAGRITRLWLTPPPTVKIPAGAYRLPTPSNHRGLEELVSKLLNRSDERGMVSRGGTRRMTQVDLDTLYAYSDLSLAERHPGWPALSFIKHVDPVQAAMLLHLIGDPRWYADPVKPNSWHRLRDAFGLGRETGVRTMERAANGEVILPKRNAQFAVQVLNTWYCADRRQQVLGDGDSKNFPWPLYFKAAAAETPAKALLKVCRVILRLVCDVWLDNLTPPREYVMPVGRSVRKSTAAPPPTKLLPSKGYYPQLFVPQHCFSEADVARWNFHISQWRSSFSTW